MSVALDPGGSTAASRPIPVDGGSGAPHAPVPLDAQQHADIQSRANASTHDPEQRELLVQGWERAASTGNTQLQHDTDQLATLYSDREVLGLSRSLAAGDAAPPGWHKADAQELSQYGVSADELHPQGSGFNAEVFVSDQPGAKPVMVFEGTDFSDPQDVNADVAQALGQPEEYYNRAMSLATQISQHTAGDVEFSGHSLGGGLATAAAEVTGASAIVSNPAGVNADTTSRFLSERGLTAPPQEPIRTYVVDGDLLTGLQGATQNLSAKNSEVLAGAFDGIFGIYNRITGGSLPTDATGSQLREIPDAAGMVTTLEARNADGSARPQALSMAEIIGRTDGIMNRDATVGGVVGTGGGILGGAAAGSIFGPLGTIGGGILGGIFGHKAGESAGRGVGAVDAGIELGASSDVRDSVSEMVQRHMAGTLYGAFDYHISQAETALRAELPR